jgi:hypothetical protein
MARGVQDLSMPVVDLAGADLTGADLAMQPPDLSGQMAMDVTINQLDTGTTPQASQLLHLAGVVVVGIANNAGVSKTSMKCEYNAFVQDPNGPAPAGIELFATGGQCATPDGGTKCNQCPYPPNSGTLLDVIGNPSNLGDVVDVYAYIDDYTPMSDGGLLPTQHEVILNPTKYPAGMIVPANMNKPVSPTVLTDGTMFATNGAGFQAYEDMVVQIKPAAAAMVSAPNMYGDFTYSGASFGGNYRFLYGKADGGTFPAAGQSFSAIAGVAIPAFGGTINPRTSADFTP